MGKSALSERANNAVFAFMERYPDAALGENVKDLLNKDLYQRLQTEAGRLYGNDDAKWAQYIEYGYMMELARIYDEAQPHLPLDECGSFAMDIAKEYARVYDVGVDIALSAMFSVIGAAAGSRIKVLYGPYENSLTLWMCIVAESGYGKTGILNALTAPLQEHSLSLIQKSERAVEDWVRAGKNGPMPLQHQLVVGDITPEARDKLLAENPEGILIHRDELHGFFEDIGRYNTSGEVQSLLTIWSGGSYAVNRKTDKTRVISRPVLGILGGTQPEVLQKIFAGHDMMVNGFFPRWSFVYAPITTTRCQGTLPPDTQQTWHDFIDGMFSLEPRPLRLDDEASKLYERYLTTSQMAQFTAESAERAVYAKQLIIVLRLAGIIYFLRNGLTGPHGLTGPPLIDAETMDAAIHCSETFTAWSFKALADIGRPQATRLSKADAIREINRLYGIRNKSMFGESIGITQQAVSKALKI